MDVPGPLVLLQRRCGQSAETLRRRARGSGIEVAIGDLLRTISGEFSRPPSVRTIPMTGFGFRPRELPPNCTSGISPTGPQFFHPFQLCRKIQDTVSAFPTRRKQRIGESGHTKTPFGRRSASANRLQLPAGCGIKGKNMRRQGASQVQMPIRCGCRLQPAQASALFPEPLGGALRVGLSPDEGCAGTVSFF